ncbi:uncharacterized protein [Argopecten irradians]|uniref:uncharacterized protein isoform X2 n=1 Tax=Argopecten irradians TaxID=31199 RepID=UPI0037190703
MTSTEKFFVGLLPPLCVVTMPIYGLFCGIDFTIYMSLLLYAYVICSEFIQLPSKLAAEMFLILNYVLHTNKRTNETVREGESVISKLALNCFMTLCYAVTALFGVSIYVEGSPLHQWLLFLVLILSVAVHVMMMTSQEGILCDAAFSCLCSMAALYAMMNETMITPPQNIDEHAQEFLKRLRGPFFWVTLLIRYYVIFFITKKVTGENLFDQVDSSTYIRKMSHQRFILVSKFVVIFMITQLSAKLIYAAGVFPGTLLFRPEFRSKDCPRDILGRILQILVIHFCYIRRLYQPIEWMMTIDVLFRHGRAIYMFDNYMIARLQLLEK